MRGVKVTGISVIKGSLLRRQAKIFLKKFPIPKGG